MENTKQISGNTVKTEGPIVRFSDSAVRKIKAMMEKEGKQNYGLRFGVVTGGCAGLSYELSLQKNSYENEHVLEHDGVRIFVNEECVSLIKGTFIDYIDTLKESGFKYHNPNAKSSCGCGTSFS